MKSISILAVGAFFALTGCGTMGSTEPQVVYRDKVVEVPVREKCTVVMPQEPEWETVRVGKANWFEYVKALLIEIEQRRDHQQKMAVAAKKCE
jgi:hypothetical protein